MNASLPSMATSSWINSWDLLYKWYLTNKGVRTKPCAGTVIFNSIGTHSAGKPVMVNWLVAIKPFSLGWIKNHQLLIPPKQQTYLFHLTTYCPTVTFTSELRSQTARKNSTPTSLFSNLVFAKWLTILFSTDLKGEDWKKILRENFQKKTKTYKLDRRVFDNDRPRRRTTQTRHNTDFFTDVKLAHFFHQGR